MKTALILGVTGQDGAYLARFLREKGYTVHGTSRHPDASKLGNLNRMGLYGKVEIHPLEPADFSDVQSLLRLVKPDEIYHLAGQSSVGLSFAQPAQTITSIVNSTQALLEALRLGGDQTRFFNVASSECYGNCERPAKEGDPFSPHSPYAAAKAAAFYFARTYRESYGLFVATGILSNHESPLRPARFVTRKIVQAVRQIADNKSQNLCLGNIRVRRDWGWAPEFVRAFWLMLQTNAPSDYNIASGETNSLEDFVREAFDAVGLDWKRYVLTNEKLSRPYEFKTTWMDPGKAKTELGWQAQYKMRDVVKFMLECEANGTLGPF
jgi:GDPmannose 4,6-dehydratase